MDTTVVITPVYLTEQNGRLELLQETLRSVGRQHAPYVHLVVDDGSPADVESLLHEQHNPNLRYIRREKII